MLDYTLIALFIPTFLIISATPGMCMTLALTLGMTVGVRKTLWMMWGELAGVAVVSLFAVLGVASVMLNYPDAFTVLKYLGGSYLVYIGVKRWTSQQKINIGDTLNPGVSIDDKKRLMQGFITAIANPKGWVFMVSLLPTFINPEIPMAPQLTALLMIILCCEFMFMMLYATGGKKLGILLNESGNVKLINHLSGALMVLIGLWLAFG